ncbi:MAG: PepSY domain-containing protein [Hyphomicrobium sp.]|uniref:PepSY domain-containing protein n=1 Tax=Hyphomicrobium sp. TaxID=82 RepID=UPI003D0E25DC
MKKLVAASLLTLALTAPALARDDDFVGPNNVPRDQWMSASQVSQKLEAAGYKLREIKVDDGAYEFEAIGPTGRIEGYAHPATGEILNSRPDNDD